MRSRHDLDVASGKIEAAIGAALDHAFELAAHFRGPEMRHANIDAAIRRRMAFANAVHDRAAHDIARRTLAALVIGEHVDRQILDDRQIAQRLQFQPFAFAPHVDDARAARPARNTVDNHRAGAAHADTAGETIGECCILRALDFGHRVENGLAVA